MPAEGLPEGYHGKVAGLHQTQDLPERHVWQVAELLSDRWRPQEMPEGDLWYLSELRADRNRNDPKYWA